MGQGGPAVSAGNLAEQGALRPNYDGSDVRHEPLFAFTHFVSERSAEVGTACQSSHEKQGIMGGRETDGTGNAGDGFWFCIYPRVPPAEGIILPLDRSLFHDPVPVIFKPVSKIGPIVSLCWA